MRDYYEVLEVYPDAEVEVITAAYKALMRKYHPDTNKSAAAAAKAQEINAAYEVLKDPARRASYDLGRKKSYEQGSAPPPPPPPPKSEAQAEGASSGNIFVTTSGALRVWLIFAASCTVAALIVVDGNISFRIWSARVIGTAIVPFAIAFVIAALWTALGQDVEQKVHRRRWLLLQAPVFALAVYGQPRDAPDEATVAVAEAYASHSLSEGSIPEPTDNGLISVRMPDGTIVNNVPDDITQSELLRRYEAYKAQQDSAIPQD